MPEALYLYPYAESNRNRQNRNLKFYPLNYRGPFASANLVNSEKITTISLIINDTFNNYFVHLLDIGFPCSGTKIET